MRPLLIIAVTLVTLQACTSNEIGNSKDVNPDAIYRSYAITYEQGDETVRCRCQFRFGGKNGTTLVLSNPGGVSLDGAALNVDSSATAGAYYSIEMPFKGFGGKHTITYTDINGKTYPQNFVFTPFTLASAVPARINAADLPLAFKGLDDGDIIHTEIEDTASATEDISREDTIQSGQILIKGHELNALKNGPLDMNFYREETMPLDNPTQEGGRMVIFYRLNFIKTVLKK